MSLIDTLKNYEHTFTAWVAKEYAKIYNATPKVEQVADATFKYVIPAVQLIAQASGNEAAAAVIGAVATEAQNSLHAASGLVYDFGPSPTAATIVSGVQDNLSQLLAAGHIKNIETQAKVTKVVNSLGALVSAIGAATAPAA